MAEPLTDDQITKMAKARVGFKTHFIVYVCVNLFLLGIWLFESGEGPAKTGDDYFWPVWPVLSWGLGLAIHGFMVYGPGSGMQQREEEKIRQQMGKT